MDTDVSISSGPSDRSSILKQFGSALRRLREKMGHTTDSSLDERLIGGIQEASGFTVWDGLKNNMLSGTGSH